jgi:hypothetical protein
MVRHCGALYRLVSIHVRHYGAFDIKPSPSPWSGRCGAYRQFGALLIGLTVWPAGTLYSQASAVGLTVWLAGTLYSQASAVGLTVC